MNRYNIVKMRHQGIGHRLARAIMYMSINLGEMKDILNCQFLHRKTKLGFIANHPKKMLGLVINVPTRIKSLVKTKIKSMSKKTLIQTDWVRINSNALKTIKKRYTHGLTTTSTLDTQTLSVATTCR
jgi:hypothetical protein